MLRHRNVTPVNYNPNRLNEKPLPQKPIQSAAASNSDDIIRSDHNVSTDENQINTNEEQNNAPDFEMVTVVGTPNNESTEIQRDLIEQSTSDDLFGDNGSIDFIQIDHLIRENPADLTEHLPSDDSATNLGHSASGLVQSEQSVFQITSEQSASNDLDGACGVSQIEYKPDVAALRNVTASNLNEICDALDQEDDLVEEIDGLTISYKPSSGFGKPFPTTGEFNLIKRQNIFSHVYSEILNKIFHLITEKWWCL